MAKKPNAWPELPWKTKLSVAAYPLLLDSTRCCPTIRRLMNFLYPKASPSTKPINGVTSSDVAVDTSRNLWFRLYVPTTTTTLPVIVYFHGGGFLSFAANSKPYNDLCLRLSRELPAIVVSVNYRLAPTHRFPSQYDDGFHVLKFIDDQNCDLFPSTADLNRCFVAGDSAGGNIAHHVMLRASEHEFKTLKFIGLIAIQPFFGGEERTESEIRLNRAPLLNLKLTDWMWRLFLPEGSDRNHEAVNVFGGETRSADISGVKFPATVVFVGGYDLLQDWQRRYHEGLKRAGKEVCLVEYPNAFHGFYVFPELPEVSLLITDMRDFIQKQPA